MGLANEFDYPLAQEFREIPLGRFLADRKLILDLAAPNFLALADFF